MSDDKVTLWGVGTMRTHRPIWFAREMGVDVEIDDRDVTRDESVDRIETGGGDAVDAIDGALEVGRSRAGDDEDNQNGEQ